MLLFKLVISLFSSPVYTISIHLMLLFKYKDTDPKEGMIVFQYILCCCSRFYLLYLSTSYPDFNTSYVVVQVVFGCGSEPPLFNFNTSYVVVQGVNKLIKTDTQLDFNTSYVVVQDSIKGLLLFSTFNFNTSYVVVQVVHLFYCVYVQI